MISKIFYTLFVFYSLLYLKAFSQEPELMVQLGHSDHISCVTFSPDSKYILSGSEDGILILWEISTGKEIKTFSGHTNKIVSVNFSSDGKFVLSGSKNGIVKIWEVKTGNEVTTINVRILNNFNELTCARFSPDEKHIITGHHHLFTPIIDTSGRPPNVNANPVVVFWDKETGKEIKTIYEESSGVNDIIISNDNKNILIKSQQYGIETMNMETGELKRGILTDKNLLMESSCFSPDGTSILTGDLNGELKSWNLKKEEFTKKTNLGNEKNNLNHFTYLLYSNDCKYILSKLSNRIKLFDVGNGNEINEFKYPGEIITSFCFSRDDKQVLSVSNGTTIRLYDIYTGNNIRTFKRYIDNITSSCFTSDGKFLLSGGRNKINLWDLTKGYMVKSFNYKRDFDEYGDWIDFSTASFESLQDNKSVLIKNIDTGAIIWDYTNNKIKSVIFPKDLNNIRLTRDKNELIASTTIEETDTTSNMIENSFFSGPKIKIRSFIELWDANNGKKIITLNEFNQTITSVFLSSDEKYILTGNLDSTVRFLDKKSGKIIKTFKGNNGAVTSVCLSSDGKYVLAGCRKLYNINNPYETSKRNIILIWDVFTGEKKGEFKDDSWTDITSVSFSLNGKYFMTISEDISKIWNINIDSAIIKVKTDTFSFSPNSKYALSKSGKEIILWDLLTGKQKNKLIDQKSFVKSTSISPDGKYILSSWEDNTTKLFDLESGNEIINLVSYGEKDYAAFTPDNYYSCSKNGYKTITFVKDNHAFPFEQFDLQYNRPDIVLERIGLAPKELIEAYRKAYLKRLKKMKFDEGMFNKDFHMPEMKILDENIPMTTTEKNINLKIKAEDSKYMLDRINVYVNDVPIYGTDGIDLRDKKTSNYESGIKLELSNGKNKVQVSVLNDKGVESLKETFDVSYEAPEVKHDLYVVAIGASDYNDSRYKLNFAAKDAKDIGDLFLNQKDKYNDVKVLKLLDKDVTRENILKAKEFLMQSKVDDEVIVFIGGHGLLTKDFDYYFATADIDFINPQNRGVTFEEIESLLDGIPARQKVLLMDTCHSGELDKEDLQIIAQNEKQVEHGEVIFRDVPGVRIGRKNENEGLGLKNTSELMQEMFVDLRRGSGAAVISSSGGLEVSFEGGGIKNGLFTYCIIEGLKTQNADLNKDGKITVSELRDYVSDKVEKLTKGIQKPTTRKENLENDFRVW